MISFTEGEQLRTTSRLLEGFGSAQSEGRPGGEAQCSDYVFLCVAGSLGPVDIRVLGCAAGRTVEETALEEDFGTLVRGYAAPNGGIEDRAFELVRTD